MNFWCIRGVSSTAIPAQVREHSLRGKTENGKTTKIELMHQFCISGDKNRKIGQRNITDQTMRENDMKHARLQIKKDSTWQSLQLAAKEKSI